MHQIRISSGIKRIEVNEAGEYIELNLGDQTFASKYYKMFDRVQEAINAMNPRALELDQKYKDANPFERQRAMCDFNAQLHTVLKEEVDNFFGEDTCRKVFGDIIPHYSMYLDFFEQLQPIFAEFAQERMKKMQKYSLGRQGNV